MMRRRRLIMRSRSTLIAVAAALLGGAVVVAEEPPHALSLGLSYLATSGNSSSRSGGLDVAYKQSFAPWGLEATGNYFRADQDGVLTAERLLLGVRGVHALLTDVDAFVSLSYLQDEFAGLNSRLVAAAGVSYKFLKGPVHGLTFDAALTYTRDDLVDGDASSYIGALAAAKYAWTISKTAKLTEDLSFLPSLEESSDWRIESKTALQAAVSTDVALKVSYALRYANRPVRGFEKTDTQTAVSLVISAL
jgi:putative salt-induced outer membrane protein